MKKIKIYCILIICCFITQFLFASDYGSITLEECINLALENNPNLKVQKGYEEYQNLVIKHRKGNFLPSVDNSYGISKRNSSYTYNEISSTSSSSDIAARLNFYYDIVNVTNALNVQSAKKWLQYRKDNTKYYEQQVKLNTTRAFYDAYRIQEVIPLFDAEVNEYAELLNFVKSKNLSEYDKIFIGIEIKELEKQIENLKNDYGCSMYYLKNVIGNSDIKIGPLNGNITFSPISTNIDNTIQKYVDLRPDVQATKALKSNSELNVKIAYSNLFPRISFGGSASYNESLTDSKTHSDAWDIGANLYVPIFGGFRRKQEIEIAKNDLKIQENSLEDIEQRAIYEIKDAYQMLTRIEKEYLLNELIIDEAKNKLDLSIDRYKKGVGNLLEIRDALNTYYGAEVGKLNLLISYKSSVANFKRAIGEI